MLAEDFANRLRKNLKKFEKWARREGIECYRLYDADLPEYNVAIDRYADWVVVQGMPRRKPSTRIRRASVCSTSSLRLSPYWTWRLTSWC